ncbi:MAG: ATP-dependent RNA helicase HrpA [Gammaproteobacteria bacterium]
MTLASREGLSAGKGPDPSTVVRELRSKLPACMLFERRMLRRRLRRLERSGVRDVSWQSASARLQRAIERSAQRAEERRRDLPTPTFPEALPITQARQAIVEALHGSQVVVVCGATGSGKTTQLPKLCLALGRGVQGLIGHTQPRRVAARSVAARIAQELNSPLGQAVGYQVRFSDRVSDGTYLKLMTDGILLAEIESDPRLERYDTLIIDEAHERTLNIDLLLGYMRQLLPKRPDLRLLIASATLDQDRFAQYFDGAAMVAIAGRSYPVEVRYRPRSTEAGPQQGLAVAVVASVEEVWRESEASALGDILVFLPGERDIREAAERLHRRFSSQVEILPLYARLPMAKQDRIFASHGGRRIVLATNVAETSLTVPNIGYVIDSGMARINRYSYRTKVQRLPIEKISRASAEQRKGRCGRVGPGVCIRLYSEDDLAGRPEFTEAEILRTDLGAVILQMKALGLGEAGTFPFLDSPDPRYLKDGYALLREIGALDEAGELTALGRRLARLPLHPRVGRILLEAAEAGCLREALVVASFLSIDDPRERPLDAKDAAIKAHLPFRHERSDFQGALALWAFYQEQKQTVSSGGLRALCRRHYLAYERMCEWLDVHQQLRETVCEMGLVLNDRPATYSQLHRALLSGFLTRVGVRTEHQDYLGPRSIRFRVSSASGMRGVGGKWVVAAELVETTRLYAHRVASLQPEWIERAAEHLVKRSYREPHWEPAAEKVMAYERVTFYGLTLVADRRIHYGSVDPAAAREIFIREALVAGRYATEAAFLEHNLALLKDLRMLEHKSRRLDLLEDEEAIVRFYEKRIPVGTCTGPAFERWRHEVERQSPRWLFLDRERLLRPAAQEVTQAAFPDTLQIEGQRYGLEYRFQPGDPADGMTVTVSVVNLTQLTPEWFEWLVPGRLPEKVFCLLRSLPKDWRRALGPLSDVSQRCAVRLVPQARPLIEALTHDIEEHMGVAIPAQAWNDDRLPEYLRMNFRVVDSDGRVIAGGRDLRRLQRKLSTTAQRAFVSLKRSDLERAGITRWDFGDVPEQVDWLRGATACRGYPALSDRQTTVAIHVVDSRRRADEDHRAGLRRLFLLELAPAVRDLKKALRGLWAMCLSYALAPPSPFAAVDGGEESTAGRSLNDSLQDEVLALIVDRAFLAHNPMIRTESQFRRCQQTGLAHLNGVAQEVHELVGAIFRAYADVRKAQARVAAADALSDIASQLEHLVFRGFLRRTDWDQLRHLPRYLQALGVRLDRLRREPAKDALKRERMGALWPRCRERVMQCHALGITDPELTRLRWMIEEFRVSLFAQELGTAYPISAKRLAEQWRRVMGS